MLRTLAKEGLHQSIRALPSRARRAIFKALAADGGAFQYELFRALGETLQVEHVGVRGDYGLVKGALEDAVMIGAYARTGRWSPMKNECLASIFTGRNGGTYIDVGANIGLTTLPVARNVAVSCKAFEPEPTSFEYLTRNVAANCPTGNVELFNLALFDRSATLEFELADNILADHRLRFDARGGHDGFAEYRRRTTKVSAVRLDSLLTASQLLPPIAAKVVAQGAEIQVLAGGEDIFKRAEALVIQFYPYLIMRAAGDPAFFAEFLAENFVSGAIIPADDPVRPKWRSIREIVDEARHLMDSLSDAPYEYFQILTRKISA
jgi:FkbM family methyltransferase